MGLGILWMDSGVLGCVSNPSLETKFEPRNNLKLEITYLGQLCYMSFLSSLGLHSPNHLRRNWCPGPVVAEAMRYHPSRGMTTVIFVQFSKLQCGHHRSLKSGCYLTPTVFSKQLFWRIYKSFKRFCFTWVFGFDGYLNSICLFFYLIVKVFTAVCRLIWSTTWHHFYHLLWGLWLVLNFDNNRTIYLIFFSLF